MKADQALAKMVSPAQYRAGKPKNGVIQIWTTRSCDKSCFGCTQGSNLRGPYQSITVEQFEQACISLKDYFGIVGVFGGNPAIHPHFESLCAILREHIPYERRGLWCNNPLGKGKIMAETFNPAVSNLNVHLDKDAYDEFRRDWPNSRPFGLDRDSRHSPVYVAMRDVIPDEGERWNLISECDINQHWSAMICVVNGNLRGFFCEIAGSMAMLHQNDPTWPDLGVEITPDWWRKPMSEFADQARFYCHRCGVPMRGHGTLAQEDRQRGVEQVSQTHEDIYSPKQPSRLVQIVTDREQLQEQSLQKFTDYLGNGEQR